MSKVIEYVHGMCRNEQDKVRSHLYVETPKGLLPMCDYGWNRSDGERYSIFRGHKSARGVCKICIKRRDAGLPPVIKARPHKTRWL